MRAGLLLLLVGLAAARAEEAPPFELHGAPEEIRPELERLLDLAYPAIRSRMRERFLIQPSAWRPYRVLVVKEAAEMRALQVQGGLGDADTLLGGFVNPLNNDAILLARPWPGSVAGPHPLPLADAKSALHEAVHQVFMRTRIGRGLPWWYREGVADLWADHLLQEDSGVSWCRMSYIPHLRVALAKEEGLSAARIFALDRSTIQGPLEYACAWSLLATIESRFPEALRRFEWSLSDRSPFGAEPVDPAALCGGEEALAAAWREFILADAAPWYARGARVSGDREALWLAPADGETDWVRVGRPLSLSAVRVSFSARVAQGTRLALYLSEESRGWHVTALVGGGGAALKGSWGEESEGAWGQGDAPGIRHLRLSLTPKRVRLEVEGRGAVELAVPGPLEHPLRLDVGVTGGRAALSPPVVEGG